MLAPRPRRLECLAPRSLLELPFLCPPDGTLVFRGVEVAAWLAVALPRKWDASSRRQDKEPNDQIATLFHLLKVALRD